MSSLQGYAIIGDPKRVEPLHKLAVEMRDNLLMHPPIQNLLLNQGYPIEEGSRPKSYHDIHGGAWHRAHVVSPSLSYVDLVLGFIEKPGIAQVHNDNTRYSAGGIILPTPGAILGEPSMPSMTIDGIDARLVEDLQAEWLANTDIAAIVRKYRSALNESFDEFNLQLVLCFMNQAKDIDGYTLATEETAIHDAIVDILDPRLKTLGEIYDTLDRAYYGKASLHEREAETLREQLDKSELGRTFILTQTDLNKRAQVVE